jgi:hypothetical protein
MRTDMRRNDGSGGSGYTNLASADDVRAASRGA